MGWLVFDGRDDECTHEGFAVAVVRDDGQFRELGYSHDERDRDFDGPVKYIAAGCDCGWRSQRFLAPLDAEWMPFAVALPQEYDDALAAVWRGEHRDHLDRPGEVFQAERASSWRAEFDRRWREQVEASGGR